jgi:shikimate kinase
VAEIFATRGEPTFREMERALTEELKSKDGMVLSPGGGWIMNPGVVDLVRPPARLIYLKVRPETALRRLGRSRTSRPLLARPDPLAELSGLLARRGDSYEKADAVVDAELLDTQQVIQQVLAVGTGT